MSWIVDPQTGERSVTLTFLVYGLSSAFILATMKLLFAGNTLFGLTWSQFSGTDYGAVIAAASGGLGGIYAWRKQQKKDMVKPNDQEA